jgi:NADP-dependent aldehyde dehydrogenase
MDMFETLMSDAVTARDIYEKWGRDEIVELLELIALDLDVALEELVEVAASETNLTKTRLVGEVGRMSGQWRHMAAVLKKGEYLGVSIDLADPTLQPPRPDLRKTNLPIGIVGVFGASNFPFGFGVGGGDTASAIASGCPVIIKAHPGHPETSKKIFEIMVNSAKNLKGPIGLFTLIQSFEDGVKLVKHKDISAIAFTGSTKGGRALFDIAQTRPEPIPFYGELGGLNPVFVTEEANHSRATAIAQGFLDSVSLGAGQFCTKPGYLILLKGVEVKKELSILISNSSTHAMLNDSIKNAHDFNRSAYARLPHVRLLAVGPTINNDSAPVTLFEISGADLLANQEFTLIEIFGPTAVVVNCESPQEVLLVAKAFHGTLASGVHGDLGDELLELGLLGLLGRISGRVLMNAWPTGVSVTWAMQHGGPYPASTNPLSTSVGADSIKRFRRPIVYQNFPQNLLPDHLKDASLASYPRNVNGTIFLTN